MAEATRRHVDNPDQPEPDWRQGYGFQFWMARHGYRGDGAYGQFCVILPEHDTVIATTADTLDMQAILDALWTHVLPAIGEPAPAERRRRAAGGAAGRRRAASARGGAGAAPIPTGGRRRFAPAGGRVAQQPTLEAVELTRSAGTWSVELQDAGGTITCPLGSGRLARSAPARSRSRPAVGGSSPTGSGPTSIFLETPHRLIIECAGDTFSATWRTEPLHTGPLRQLRLPVPGVAVAG